MGLLALSALAVAQAQEAAPPGSAPKDNLSNSMSKDLGFDIKPGDLMTVERFVSMPPEKIREVIRALEKIAALSDAERAQLVERLKTFRMMNEEKRKMLFLEFKQTSPRDRDLVKRYLQSLPKEDQQKFRDEMNNLKAPKRLEMHREMVEKAKAAGIEPNLKLSDVPGDDMPKNLRRGPGHPQIPEPGAPPPPPEGVTPPQAPKLPSPDAPAPAAEMP